MQGEGVTLDAFPGTSIPGRTRERHVENSAKESLETVYVHVLLGRLCPAPGRHGTQFEDLYNSKMPSRVQGARAPVNHSTARRRTAGHSRVTAASSARNGLYIGAVAGIVRGADGESARFSYHRRSPFNPEFFFPGEVSPSGRNEQ